ncbi:MAG: hypothetical protein R3181_11685 [Rubricoccaceae bacterium]|nr:hypothetical protein [Rubricoccaceae bacterium]
MPIHVHYAPDDALAVVDLEGRLRPAYLALAFGALYALPDWRPDADVLVRTGRVQPHLDGARDALPAPDPPPTGRWALVGPRARDAALVVAGAAHHAHITAFASERAALLFLGRDRLPDDLVSVLSVDHGPT